MAMVGGNVCLAVDPLLSADHIVSTLSKRVHNSRAGDWNIRKGTDSPPTVRRAIYQGEQTPSETGPHTKISDTRKGREPKGNTRSNVESDLKQDDAMDIRRRSASRDMHSGLP
ncbi:hypothetical protein NW767_001297 [Fusarium falciforme]|nr:hypothetical protein NW767_001297 [Fusarium falciforme]KAJ4262701.1 hypothetical protein NW757_000953 [Fusarium falciforme]